ncbi:MAG: PD-(D/E)XK nuclease family protein, partial [Spirochaetota bacterium]
TNNDTFFRLFIENTFYSGNYNEIQLNTVSVIREKQSDGRIDIFVEFLLKEQKKCCIIIENKIYAQEQENQLNRYFDHEAGKYSFISLIYLTLHGNESNTLDFKNKDVIKKNEHYEFKCLSYADDIINWIDLCIKESSLTPPVREILYQYNLSLKDLTNQSLSKEEENEMQELIFKDVDNYKAAEKICENFQSAKENIIKLLVERLIKSLERFETQGYLIGNELTENPLKKHKILSIYKKEWKNEEKNIFFRLIISPQDSDFKDVLIGIFVTNCEGNEYGEDNFNKILEIEVEHSDEKTISVKDIISNIKKEDFSQKPCYWYLIYAYIKPDFSFEKYADEKEEYLEFFQENCIDKINYLIEDLKINDLILNIIEKLKNDLPNN